MSLTRISSRYNRRVSFVVLCCYGALVLLLSLHHHTHGRMLPGERIGMPVQPHGSHGHIAADCPLLHYAVTAFQYAPSGAAVTVPLPGLSFLATQPLAFVPAIMAGGQLSRGPPATA
jgi:hypothetical protein